jgi:heme A synthase
VNIQARNKEEIPLNWNIWIRQIHRWLSMAITVTVIIYFIAVARGTHADWLGFLALLPLFLLLFSGLYLFALPYATKWRSG